MDSFYIAFNAVMPITFLVVFGYYLKQKDYLDKNTISKLNKICFKVFLPVLTFNNITKANIKEIFDIKLLSYAVISIVFTVIALNFIVNLFEKDKKKQGSIIQGIYRSNFVILGLPLTNHIAGTSGSAITSILIMVVIPVFNILAVIILATHSGKNKNIRQVFADILKNPLIIASVMAIVFSVLDLKLPTFADKIIADISKLGGVLPMIVLGGMLDLSQIYSNFLNIIISVLGKLILVPIVFIPIAILIGFRDEKMISLIALYCSPTAVSSAIMAGQMGCDEELAAQIVIFTTVFSCLTIFCWVFLLSYLNFI